MNLTGKVCCSSQQHGSRNMKKMTDIPPPGKHSITQVAISIATWRPVFLILLGGGQYANVTELAEAKYRGWAPAGTEDQYEAVDEDVSRLQDVFYGRNAERGFDGHKADSVAQVLSLTGARLAKENREEALMDSDEEGEIQELGGPRMCARLAQAEQALFEPKTEGLPDVSVLLAAGELFSPDHCR